MSLIGHTSSDDSAASDASLAGLSARTSEMIQRLNEAEILLADSLNPSIGYDEPSGSIPLDAD